MPGAKRLKADRQTEEQKFVSRRYAAIEQLAREAGFDDDAFAYTEFCLEPFFKLIVEKCAEAAEDHAVNYSGDAKEEVGCKGAASAVRAFGDFIGNTKERVYTVGPVKTKD